MVPHNRFRTSGSAQLVPTSDRYLARNRPCGTVRAEPPVRNHPWIPTRPGATASDRRVTHDHGDDEGRREFLTREPADGIAKIGTEHQNLPFAGGGGEATRAAAARAAPGPESGPTSRPSR